jgi:hypothetical protein
MTTVDQASRDFMVAANRLPTLYALTDEFNYLIALLEDEAQDQDAIEAELTRLAGNIKEKAYGIAVMLQSLENMAEVQRAEARRMAARASANEKHAGRLREFVLQRMQSIPGLRRLETGVFTLAIRLNNPSVKVLDEQSIPSDFWRTYEPPPPEVNKVAIMDAWRATGGRSTREGIEGGVVPPGVEIVRNERLDIK